MNEEQEQQQEEGRQQQYEDALASMKIIGYGIIAAALLTIGGCFWFVCHRVAVELKETRAQRDEYREMALAAVNDKTVTQTNWVTVTNIVLSPVIKVVWSITNHVGMAYEPSTDSTMLPPRR